MISMMNQMIWDIIATLNVILFCIVIIFSFKIYAAMDHVIQQLDIKSEYGRIIKISISGIMIIGALFFFGMVAYLDTLQNHLKQIGHDLNRLVQSLPATP